MFLHGTQEAQYLLRWRLWFRYPTQTRQIFSVVLSSSFLGDVPSWIFFVLISSLFLGDVPSGYYQQHSILSAGDCGFVSNVDSPLSPPNNVASFLRSARNTSGDSSGPSFLETNWS
ncbi:Formiminotransferase cyclodeaminase-like protein [Trichinella spiralis]|uniref:Formiminotransferase cyclodeaminase-like protein n=1 Tax=Trichinella spiralis TaxID=6334 RepID=A0ABR3KRN2_TRISP